MNNKIVFLLRLLMKYIVNIIFAINSWLLNTIASSRPTEIDFIIVTTRTNCCYGHFYYFYCGQIVLIQSLWTNCNVNVMNYIVDLKQRLLICKRLTFNVLILLPTTYGPYLNQICSNDTCCYIKKTNAMDNVTYINWSVIYKNYLIELFTDYA